MLMGIIYQGQKNKRKVMLTQMSLSLKTKAFFKKTLLAIKVEEVAMVSIQCNLSQFASIPPHSLYLWRCVSLSTQGMCSRTMMETKLRTLPWV